MRGGEGGGRGGAGRGEDSYIQNTDPHRTGQTDRQRNKQIDRWMDNVTVTTRGNIQTHHVTQPGGGDSTVPTATTAHIRHGPAL